MPSSAFRTLTTRFSFRKARAIKPDVQLGEEIEVEVTPRDFGRIAAQTARQAIMQRIRQAEKEMIYEEFKDRAGEIVSGTVRRFEQSGRDRGSRQV